MPTRAAPSNHLAFAKRHGQQPGGCAITAGDLRLPWRSAMAHDFNHNSVFKVALVLGGVIFFASLLGLLISF